MKTSAMNRATRTRAAREGILMVRDAIEDMTSVDELVSLAAVLRAWALHAEERANGLAGVRPAD